MAWQEGRGGGGAPYNDVLYRKASYNRLVIYKTVGISSAEV